MADDGRQPVGLPRHGQSNGATQRQVITVTPRTKLMADGITARVVRDVVTDHGAMPGIALPAHPTVGLSYREEYSKGVARPAVNEARESVGCRTSLLKRPVELVRGGRQPRAALLSPRRTFEESEHPARSLTTVLGPKSGV